MERVESNLVVPRKSDLRALKLRLKLTLTRPHKLTRRHKLAEKCRERECRSDDRAAPREADRSVWV